MNEIEFIKKLDAVASTQSQPLDVTDNVLRRIHTARTAPADSTPMWIGVIFSTLAAAAVFIFAFQSLTGFQDPFGDLLNPLWTAFR
jgi:hypothetical protein